MGIKSIVSVALAAATLVGLSTAPAQADNNSKYMNQLAMQMYAQNMSQGAAYSNPYAYGNYGAGYNYTGQTPWSAGAMPYAYASGNPYGNRYGRYNNPQYNHRAWGWH